MLSVNMNLYYVNFVDKRALSFIRTSPAYLFCKVAKIVNKQSSAH